MLGHSRTLLGLAEGGDRPEYVSAVLEKAQVWPVIRSEQWYISRKRPCFSVVCDLEVAVN